MTGNGNNNYNNSVSFMLASLRLLHQGTSQALTGHSLLGVERRGDAGLNEEQRYNRLWFHWRAGVCLKSWIAVVCVFACCSVTLAVLVLQYLEHRFSCMWNRALGMWLKKFFPGCLFVCQWLNVAVPPFHCLCLWVLHFELSRSSLKLMFANFNW